VVTCHSAGRPLTPTRRLTRKQHMIISCPRLVSITGGWPTLDIHSGVPWQRSWQSFTLRELCCCNRHSRLHAQWRGSSCRVRSFWSGRQSHESILTREVVSHLDVPVFIAHGKRDRVVPFRMGVEVYEAAKRKGQLLLVDNAGHNDVADVGGPDYWTWVKRALSPNT